MRLVGALDATLGTVALTGTGIGPAVGVPVSTDFGTRARVDRRGADAERRPIANAGEQTLTVTSARDHRRGLRDQFAARRRSMSTAGTQVNVSITFDPSMSGTRNATLDVSSNDPVAPMVTSGLTGVGGNAIVTVGDVNFGDVTDNTTVDAGRSRSRTRGTPTGPLTVTSATISGGSWFTFDNNGAASCARPDDVHVPEPRRRRDAADRRACAARRCRRIRCRCRARRSRSRPTRTRRRQRRAADLHRGPLEHRARDDALTFGDQRVGTTSAAQTVTA